MKSPEATPIEPIEKGALAKAWGSLDISEKKSIKHFGASAAISGIIACAYLGIRQSYVKPVSTTQYDADVESAYSNLDLLDQLYPAIVLPNDHSYIEVLDYDGKDHSFVFPTLTEATLNRELNEQFMLAQDDPTLGTFVVRIRQAETTEAAVEVLMDAKESAREDLYQAEELQDASNTNSETNPMMPISTGVGVFALIAVMGSAVFAYRRHRSSKKVAREAEDYLKTQVMSGGSIEAEPEQPAD